MSPRGPVNHPPLIPTRKARIAAEFGLSSTTYVFDAPTYNPNQVTPRRLEIYRNQGIGRGMQGFPYGEVGFEAGAVLAVAQYLCTYIDRSPFWSYLPRGATENEQQQRLSFWLPALQEQQKILIQGSTTSPGQTQSVADGRVTIVFNPYRQVAAVAVPSISHFFRIHRKKVPLKHVLNTQPQAKIVPEFDHLDLSDSGGCPVVSMGREMHFILVDITAAPNMLAALTSGPGLAKKVDEHILLDDEPAWGLTALKSGYIGSVWYVRGKKDEVNGEATIENLRCRIFADVNAWEEEGLGSGAAAVGGWLALHGDTNDNDMEEKMGKLNVSAAKDTENQSTENESNDDEDKAHQGEEGNDPTQKDEDLTPKQTRTQPPTTTATTASSTTTAATNTSQPKPKEKDKDQPKTQRKVFGIQTGVEIRRHSTIAVEVDVIISSSGNGRRLGGMAVSGRANFETKGELLGA
jgi:hypothetical protein